MQKFKEGDKVVLISSEYSSHHSNPVWGENDEYISGIITEISGLGDRFIVRWENDSSNVYNLEDLELLENVSKTKQIEINYEELDRLVKSKEDKEELVSVLKQFENYDLLFNTWGLGKVVEYGKGMVFLFHGPPGCGKTWAATCMSKGTGKELHLISSAEIQTSEPGGANRNIQEAFAHAQKKNKLLFFDECDSLITARDDVGMILGSEINTLLTEIEKYEGIVILATNRADTLDAALERRITLIMKFDPPNFKERSEIWKKMLPEELPLAENVTLKKLSEYNLTGGEIKNVLLQAARFAVAENADKVLFKHFERAIKRLMDSKGLLGKNSMSKKIGKHLKQEDFDRSGGQKSIQRSSTKTNNTN